ncbi:MAG: porin [Gammaproteobacteria bacterium]|jgi:hypothetical protein
MQEQAPSQPRSEAASWAERTRLGGYGELHYRNLDSNNEIDFRRFVLFFGHRFMDRIRFWSELELEHALTGEDAEGELELEQAFLEFDLTATQRLRAGLYLVPVGILNETHEPTTFYGVERNPVERNIIPTTWWEGAIGATGQLPINGESPLAQGWSYDLMLGSGLNSPISSSNAFLIRSGRQKVSKAKANDGAVTARIRWRGIPGIEWAATGQYQADITQGALDIGATLFETHIDARHGPFGLRALWAGWWLDDGPLGLGPRSGPSPGRERQTGWYIEPSYRFGLPGRIPGELGFFARYNQWNNNAGSGGTGDQEQVDVGFNYWPISDVVFKFDYQEQISTIDDDGFSLGLGFQF